MIDIADIDQTLHRGERNRALRDASKNSDRPGNGWRGAIETQGINGQVTATISKKYRDVNYGRAPMWGRSTARIEREVSTVNRHETSFSAGNSVNR